VQGCREAGERNGLQLLKETAKLLLEYRSIVIVSAIDKNVSPLNWLWQVATA
jgi:hypothetical protein